ncbi:MAG: hypothetical protein AAF806_12740 [Bacteroidota bacterium]
MKSIILAFALILLSSFSLIAQDKNSEDKIWIIRTSDGSEFIGLSLSENDNFLILENEVLGVIEIPIEQVIWKRQVKRKNIITFDRRPRTDAVSTHYFFAPNAYNLKKGGGYFQNTLGIHNQVTYAPGDRFSIGVNIIPMFLWQDLTPVWLNAKYTFPIKDNRLNFALGIYGGNIFDIGDNYQGDNFQFMLPYAAMTFGSRESNWTVAMGYGRSTLSFDLEFEARPFFSLSGVYKLGRISYFVTENHISNRTSYTQVVSSAGFRWVSRKFSADLGVVAFVLGDGDVIPIPLFSFSIPFGASAKLE